VKVQLEHLSRRFGKTPALSDLSFELNGPGITGFIGPNGAGKTTALKLIAGLDVPQNGDVKIDGVSVVDYPEVCRRKIGFMPDTLPDCRDMTVHDYLLFYAQVFLPRVEVKTRLAEIGNEMSLGSMQRKKLCELSKGMKQRVSLARILLHDPDLLLLDEPAAGLDPRARLELRDTLTRLANQGKTILLSSHILSELEDMCDGAVILEKGNLVFSGLLRDFQSGAAKKSVLTVIFAKEEWLKQAQKSLQGVPDVLSCRQLKSSTLEVVVASGCGDAVAAILFGEGLHIAELRNGEYRADWEDLFLRTTQNEVQ